MDARGATIRLRWSRAEMEMPACYKHSAPLEPGGDGNACVLQTFGSAGAGRRWMLGGLLFGSAGAGRRWKCLRATNIRLRWSRVATEMPACYKHSAPLEPGGDGGFKRTNFLPSAGDSKPPCSQTSAPDLRLPTQLRIGFSSRSSRTACFAACRPLRDTLP